MRDNEEKQFWEEFLLLEKMTTKKVLVASGLADESRTKVEIIASIHSLVRLLENSKEIYPDQYRLAMEINQVVIAKKEGA